MEKLSFDYYKNSYGGSLSLNEFNRYSLAAEKVISMLVSTRSLPENDLESYDAYLRAVCLELDCIAENDKNPSFDGRVAVSEGLGNYSVTYAGGGRMNVDGVLISPEAVLYLKSAGLFSRWI